MEKDTNSAQGGTLLDSTDGKALPAGTVAKRGRGRPKGSLGKVQAPDVLTVSKPDTSRDPVFVVETAVKVLEIADDSFSTILVSRARRVLHPNFLPEFEKEVNSVKWSESEMEINRRCFVELANKYNWATKYGAEICLLLMMVQHVAAMGRTLAMLSKIEKEAVRRSQAVNQTKETQEVKNENPPADKPAPAS